MIQLRWLVTTDPEPKLQYRQQYNTTIYAGMPTEKQKLETANYEWSDWMDVPVVSGTMTEGDRSPRFV